MGPATLDTQSVFYLPKLKVKNTQSSEQTWLVGNVDKTLPQIVIFSANC